jgi:hypothetical protein
MLILKAKIQPTRGDSRAVRKFAWLPTSISGVGKIWLEHYLEHQTYVKDGGNLVWAYFGNRERIKGEMTVVNKIGLMLWGALLTIAIFALGALPLLLIRW